MTTTTETPAFTETFLQLLQLLAPGRGNLSLHIRTLHGIGVVQPLRVRPVPECLSPPLLEFLDGEFEIRSQIVTVETDASPVEMTAAAVIFRLPTKFSKETEWGFKIHIPNIPLLRKTAMRSGLGKIPS